MKHEELLKELLEVCLYLKGKDVELQQKYGEFPVFESEADKWVYRILEGAISSSALTLVKEFEDASGYMSMVGEQGYHAGEGLKLAQETGQLQF